MKFKLKQLFKMLSQHVIFPFAYFLNRWRPVDENLVVLADAHHDRCPSHMEEIKQALDLSHFRVKEYFADISELGVFAGLRHLIGFMRLYAGAGYVVICDNYLPVSSCRKKKQTRVVQLWHGCGAFKRFGYDAEDDIPAGYRGNVYKNYDLVTVSGEKCVPYFVSAMGIWSHDKKEEKSSVVRPLGVSHTDRLFRQEYRESCMAKLFYLYPEARDKRVVLYAPTFRGNAGKAVLTGGLYMDALMQDEELKQDVLVIKSLHPHLLRGNRNGGEDAGRGMTTDELLVCADVLITDYSSVFFEYLLTDRPIIFFAPDFRSYAGKRGFYLDYGTLPGYVVKGTGSDAKASDINIFMLEELRGALKSAIYDEDAAMRDLRDKYRAAYMNACDGQATSRIMSTFFGRGQENDKENG